MSEKLHGVRAWELAVDVDGHLRLAGAYCRQLWELDGKTTWARCAERGRATGRHQGSAPSENCSCGLYALHPWAANEIPSGTNGPSVVGVVEAWGTVLLHQEGFRAQYARPVALALTGVPQSSEWGRVVSRLARAHGAELVQVGSLAGLTRHCRAHKLGLARKTVGSLLAPDANAA